MRERPLSPHLTVYRFMYTMALSIAHRIAGLVLSLGLLFLVLWLMAAATSALLYAEVLLLLGSSVAKVFLGCWLLAFFYHLCNGIRHLVWDRGYGFERHEARRSARITIAATLLLFVVATYFLFFSLGVL